MWEKQKQANIIHDFFYEFCDVLFYFIVLKNELIVFSKLSILIFLS